MDPANKGDEGIRFAKRHALQRIGQAEAHQGPDAHNGFDPLLRRLVLGRTGRNRGHRRINLGNQRIQFAHHGLEFGCKATQMAHRQLERALETDDRGTPSNEPIQLALIRRGGRVGTQVRVLLRDQSGDQFRIHPVGFGPAAQGLGIVPSIQRVQQEDGMTVGLRQVRQQFVIGAGGFQANAAACRERCQPCPQWGPLIGNTLDRKTSLSARDHNSVFGHIHADIQNGLHHRRLLERHDCRWGGPHRRELADKSAVRGPAARFFIDVCSVGGRVLRESVRRAADASRCPSTPAPRSFSRMSTKTPYKLVERLTMNGLLGLRAGNHDRGECE